MESLDYWRKCEQLSVVQAAKLIFGIDPTPMAEDDYYAAWGPLPLPVGYMAVYAALQGSILSGELKATIRRDPKYPALDVLPGAMVQFQEGGIQLLQNVWPDWNGTLIRVADLKEWLVQRGIESEFFFPDGAPAAQYLNRGDPCFSPKLFAAIGAWMAVKADPGLRRGKSVKSALSTWLNQHAAQYGLTKRDGTPNNTAIEEAAKVANWESTGGAPKTPE
jgi:hypothetical protein